MRTQSDAVLRSQRVQLHVHAFPCMHAAPGSTTTQLQHQSCMREQPPIPALWPFRLLSIAHDSFMYLAEMRHMMRFRFFHSSRRVRLRVFAKSCMQRLVPCCSQQPVNGLQFPAHPLPYDRMHTCICAEQGQVGLFAKLHCLQGLVQELASCGDRTVTCMTARDVHLPQPFSCCCCPALRCVQAQT